MQLHPNDFFTFLFFSFLMLFWLLLYNQILRKEDKKKQRLYKKRAPGVIVGLPRRISRFQKSIAYCLLLPIIVSEFSKYEAPVSYHTQRDFTAIVV